MNLQDIRYLLKTDLKDLADARRNRPGENSGAPKADAPPEISIFLPPTSAISQQEPDRQAEMAPEVRSFTASRCAASPSEPEDPGVGEAEPVVRMAESSLLLEAAAPARDDTDESLCSFEINEIYTCYPELCEEEEEEEEERVGEGSGAGRQSRSPTRVSNCCGGHGPDPVASAP
ncbi:hypothetical protein JRQ81_008103 [Phrynocephalus forsythii]|uniref:Uncharacterized protein n=1 Tax=Phrynocephalus forsythii TaxID=171643 RepID=A0A9Q0XB98_9SAUR|nr:hypothetical protein JRQ81_008103 [Phrynocephalus forsythii]